MSYMQVKSSRHRTATSSEILLWVCTLLTIITIAFPVGAILYGTLRTDSPTALHATWTLANLQSAYLTNEYLKPLLNTLYVAVIATALATSIGVVIAWLVARTDIPLKRTLETLVIMPIFLSTFTSAVAWITLASPRAGFINIYLRQWLNLDAPVVNIYSVAGIVWVLTISFVPYVYLLSVGALRSMDPALEEASHMLGGGVIQTLRRVTLPLALPAIGSSALLIFVLASEVFTVPAVLGTDVRYFNLLYQVYAAIAQYPSNYPKAAAAGTLLLWFTFGGMYVYQRLIRQSSKFVTITARGYQPRQLRLRRWKGVALTVVLLYFFVAVVLPYCVLVLTSLLPFAIRNFELSMLTLANYQAIFTNARTASAFSTTLWLALAGATICVLLGLLISYTIYRTRVPGRRVIEYVGMMPLTVPGLVMAVGILWAYVQLPLPLYGTMALLVIAYVTRYLAYALRGIGSGLLQIDRTLEEAATVAGASTLRVLRDITVRLLGPALMSTWLLIFIIVVREVELALLLISPSTSVVSVLMWDYLWGSEFSTASALGVLQTVIILLIVFIAQRIFRLRLRGL